MDKAEIKEVQNIAKDILFRIIDFCNKNDVEYFLMYGSLIGAVRHGGIIPWDDDIDIGMTRENYNRFLELSSKKPFDDLDILVMGSRETLSEIKVGKKGTKYCDKDAVELNIASQITVDIFLVDRIKELSTFQNKYASKIRMLLRLCSLSWDEKKLLMINIDRSSHKFKFLYKSFVFIMHSLLILFGEKKLLKWIYELYVDKTGTSTRMACAMFDDYTYPATSAIISMSFEGVLVNVLECFDEMLTKQYGNYMELPPVEQRYNKHLKDWVLEIDADVIR